MQEIRDLPLQRAKSGPSPVRWGTERWLKALWLVVFLALPLGCGQVRLVSPYDEQIDAGTSEAHTEIAQFVARMAIVAGSDKGTYASNADFYAGVTAKVSTLKLRAAARDKNAISVKLFEELLTSIGTLQELHKSGEAGGLSTALGGPHCRASTSRRVLRGQCCSLRKVSRCSSSRRASMQLSTS